MGSLPEGTKYTRVQSHWVSALDLMKRLLPPAVCTLSVSLWDGHHGPRARLQWASDSMTPEQT